MKSGNKLSSCLLPALLTCLTIAPALLAAESIDLSGTWRFAADPHDLGQQQQWFRADLPGKQSLTLPGSMQQQGFGDDPGPSTQWTGNINQNEWSKPRYAPYRSPDNFKMPFWLQPEKYYAGPAWCQKTVSIPLSWKDKHVTLTLERPHWQTTLWVDSKPADAADYLSAPHTCDLTNLLTPGEHVLTIRVDNRMIVNVGPNSHSVSDHTQSNWNGIVGRITLTAQPPVWIDDVQIFPDLPNNAIRVVTQSGARSSSTTPATLAFDVSFGGKHVAASQTKITLDQPTNQTETLIPLTTPAKTWDEFNPNLYTLTTRLAAQSTQDEHTTTFAMRQVSTDANHFILNTRRIFLRGTLECCIFPKTGYPPTDVDSWKRIITICKAHGLNHIRFHSWCPPEAAFSAADQLGFYYQVECSSWANSGSSIGNGKDIDSWLYKEADAILKAYGNHPSFLLFAYGNEPAGPEGGAAYLRKWVAHYKHKDPRRLVTSASGWPIIEQSDYHVSPAPRIQAWGEQLKSRINSAPPETQTDYRDFTARYPTQPIISHEIGQWCVYPNFDEMKKYTGVLKPKNFEVFRDFLKNKGLLDQAHDFLMASGKLQTLCYKEDIESALRTPDFGGFELLDLHDFPGQGTALVGVLDPFWDSKPYVTPAQYHRFCGPIVPLARMARRIFTSSDTLSAQIDLSQFGPADLTDLTLDWSLLDSQNRPVAHDALHKEKTPAGSLSTIGDISIPLSALSAPAKYTLQVTVQNTTAVNDWDIWLYPDTLSDPADDSILIATSLDPRAIAHLRKGGKVFLNPPHSLIDTSVKIGFSSIFWNTAWTNGQAPHTLGILCDPHHPALASFPTEYHSNWQWSPLIQTSAALEMDNLPAPLRPIVQVVPDWFDPKRLALILEAKTASGSILVCSIDLSGDLTNRPVHRQLRHSLLDYMRSPAFRPETTISLDSVNALFTEPSPLQKLAAKVIRTDSAEPGYEGPNAIDNDPATLWHTEWSARKSAHPHEILIDLQHPTSLSALTCLPRQDRNPNGRIRQYALCLSNDTAIWPAPAATGEFSPDASLKTIRLDKPTTARYIRLVALSGFGSDPFTSLAELNVITP